MENQDKNLQELEELRSQVAEFKSRIEQQEIVSRRMLDEAMSGHVSWIKSINIWMSVFELLLLPLIPIVLRSIGSVSWGAIAFVGLLFVGDAAFNFWNVGNIRDKHLLCDDVLGVQQRLMSYKRREKLQLFIEIPLLLACLAWILFEVYHGTGAPFPLARFTVMLISGFAFMFFLFYREMRSLNKAIREINEFTRKE